MLARAERCLYRCTLSVVGGCGGAREQRCWLGGAVVMASIVVLALLVLPVSPQAKANTTAPGWYLADNALGRATDLYDVDFVDASHGYAVGGQGVFTRTQDGGKTWTTKTIDPDKLRLRGVSFPDRLNGYAVGTSKIFATTDGGETWTRQFACEDLVATAPCTATSSNIVRDLTKVVFTDTLNGHAVSGTAIVSTVNGGATWRYTRAPTALRDLAFTDGPNCPPGISGCYGHVVGNQGLIMATSDGGATWTQQFVCKTSSPCTAASPDRDASSDALRSYAAVSFSDELRGHAVGPGVVIATNDGGQTWREQTTPDGKFSNFMGISFSDANHGRAIGGGKAIGTTDGGATWRFESIFIDNRGGEAVSCTTRLKCHAAGTAGVWVFATGEDDEAPLPPPGPPLAPEAWGRQTNAITGTDETLRAAAFTDGPGCPPDYPKGCYGYAVGDSGVILATRDGGRNWRRQISGTTDSLASVAFTDHLRGHVGGGSGTILSTTDGGATWVSQPAPDLCDIFRCYGVRGIAFSDGPGCPSTYSSGCYGFAVSAGPKKILATSDGGTTWTPQNVSGATVLHAVSCADHLHCHAVGEASSVAGGAAAIILGTSDGGNTWIPESTGVADGSLRGVSFPDIQHGRAVGVAEVYAPTPLTVANSRVKRSFLATETGGAGWAAQTDTTGPTVVTRLNAVSFSDPEHGHAVGGHPFGSIPHFDPENSEQAGKIDPLNATDGSIHSTADGGLTWSQQFVCSGVGPCTASSSDRLRAGFYGVSFTDGQNGHIVGEQGLVLGTTDGGRNWNIELHGTTDLLGASFPDAMSGYAVGEDGAVLATADQGSTWARQASGVTATLRSVWFISAVRGFAVGDAGTIVATVDGGATWRPQQSGTTSTLRGVAFVDPSTGYAVGDGGTILATTNGGATWATRASGTTDRLRSLSFVTAQVGAVVGDAGTIMTTADGGQSWTKQSSEVSYDLTSVSFSDAMHGHAVGPDSFPLHVLATADGGRTWRKQYVCRDYSSVVPCSQSSTERRLDDVQLRAVVFSDSLNGHAVGVRQSEGSFGTGVILATNDGGARWFNQLLTGLDIGALSAVTSPRNDSRFTWAMGGAGTIASTFSPPGAPSDLSAAVLNRDTVRLTWGAVGENGDGQGAAVTHYRIYQATQPITTSFDAPAVEVVCDGACFGGTLTHIGDRATFDIAGLGRGVGYHWAVRAVDRDGLVGPAATVSAQIPDLGPGAVTDLVATALSDRAVELSFSAPGSDDAAPPPATSYLIKQSRTPISSLEDFDKERALCGGLDCTTLSPRAVGDRLTLKVTSLTPDTTYFYALRARDEAGQLGPLSNVAQVTTAPLCPPVAPSATQVAYPAGYSLVGLPADTRVQSQSPLYGWFNQRAGDYSVDQPDQPTEPGRGYWAWFACPQLVELPGPGGTDASFALGAYQASMVGNPSGGRAADVSGHDFTARWDRTMNEGSGGYVLSAFREPSTLAVGEGIWAFSYRDTTLKISQQ